MLNIKINGKPEQLDETIATVADLVREKAIPSAGTAIAVNGKLVKSDHWKVTQLADGDNVMIISAAYGG